MAGKSRVERHLDGMDRAIQNAKNWEREKTIRTFQSGFCFALACIMLDERDEQKRRDAGTK